VFDTQRWRASPVWLLYNLLRAIQFNVHAVQFFYVGQLTKASFNENRRGLARVGVVTQKFSGRSARALFQKNPLLKFLDPPLLLFN